MSKKIKEVSAGILFFTEDYELFMGRVTNSGLGGGPSRWDIPKGHIEEGETPIEAAIREAKREIEKERNLRRLKRETDRLSRRGRRRLDDLETTMRM